MRISLVISGILSLLCMMNAMAFEYSIKKDASELKPKPLIKNPQSNNMPVKFDAPLLDASNSDVKMEEINLGNEGVDMEVDTITPGSAAKHKK